MEEDERGMYCTTRNQTRCSHTYCPLHTSKRPLRFWLVQAQDVNAPWLRGSVLVGARVGGFVLSLGMAGNRPGFRIRRDSKSFNSMRENEQRKPSVYPHEASTEQFEMRGNNAREKVRGKRKSKKNWISPRLNLLCPTFQPPMS